MIICAAIKVTISEPVHDEIIICGHRHGDCLMTIQSLCDYWDGHTKVQGFINHKGEFLDRKEALKHAIECGQLSKTHMYYQKDNHIDELYSEDLY